MPEGVDHVAYVVPGIVDQQVVKDQAERRFERNNETSIVHDHRRDEKCSVKCKKFDGEWKILLPRTLRTGDDGVTW